MARSRRRSEEAEAQLTPSGEAVRLSAQRAYFLSLFALIPGPSLILGPVAAVRGLLAWRRGRREPGFPGKVTSVLAMIIGSLITVTGWLGVALMIIGLQGD